MQLRRVAVPWLGRLVLCSGRFKNKRLTLQQKIDCRRYIIGKATLLMAA